MHGQAQGSGECSVPALGDGDMARDDKWHALIDLYRCNVKDLFCATSCFSPTTKPQKPISPFILHPHSKPFDSSTPMDLNDHIEKILWDEEQISKRVSELGTQITRDFKTRTDAPTIVGVATGAFLFLADLVRKIHLPISVDFIRVGSYGSGTVSNGRPTISLDLKVDVRGKHVVLVEDIVDTGSTLSYLIDHLKSKGASSISVCTLLDKPARRKVHFQLVGEGKYYCGFECPDYFVVGYGMDMAELYRNLPYIGVLKPEMYS